MRLKIARMRLMKTMVLASATMDRCDAKHGRKTNKKRKNCDTYIGPAAAVSAVPNRMREVV